MSTSTRSPGALSLFDPFTARGLWLRWLPTFLGFIAGGALAIAVTGPVTNLPAALGGGALAGAVIGAGQWLALRGRLSNTLWWIPATIVGQAVGLAGGAALVGYRTGIQDLAIQGAITGLGSAPCRGSSCVRTLPPGSGGRSRCHRSGPWAGS